jgi:hypothetical protein
VVSTAMHNLFPMSIKALELFEFSDIYVSLAIASTWEDHLEEVEEIH